MWLTHNLQQRVQEAVHLVLQGIMGAQGHGEVPISLSVADVHLNLCGKRC